MTKTVIIDGKEYTMKSSALVPRLYRAKFGRDMIRDMSGLTDVYKKALSLPEDATDEQRREVELDVLDYLEVFENVAWLFLRHAGNDIPDSPDAWLESIEGVFSIYEIMPTIVELWGAEQQTTSIPKNRVGQR